MITNIVYIAFLSFTVVISCGINITEVIDHGAVDACVISISEIAVCSFDGKVYILKNSTRFNGTRSLVGDKGCKKISCSSDGKLFILSDFAIDQYGYRVYQIDGNIMTDTGGSLMDLDHQVADYLCGSRFNYQVWCTNITEYWFKNGNEEFFSMSSSNGNYSVGIQPDFNLRFYNGSSWISLKPQNRIDMKAISLIRPFSSDPILFIFGVSLENSIHVMRIFPSLQVSWDSLRWYLIEVVSRPFNIIHHLSVGNDGSFVLLSDHFPTWGHDYVINLGFFLDHSCFGISSRSSSVCHGHGICLYENTCVCEDPNFVGENCNETIGKSSCGDGDCGNFKCFKLLRDDANVCSGHGDCVAIDSCECNFPYTERDCNALDYDMVLILGGGISAGTTSFFLLLGIAVICFCFSCFFTCYSYFCACCLLICPLLVLFQSFNTARRSFKVSTLEKSIDVLLEEQRLENDSSVAHIRINTSSFQIPMKELLVMEVLGVGGSNSMVFRAIWKGNVVAFKCFKTRHILSSQDSFDEFEREVSVMVSTNHPHIIQFFGCSMRPPRLGIVMEYAEKGDLLKFMTDYRKENKERYPFTEKLTMIHGIVMAMDYLHSRNIMHRDLKLENILVSKNDVVKLVDFGLSKIVDNLGTKRNTTRVGTDIYIPPEVLNNDQYSEKCDVYSFAILLYIFLTENTKPFGDDTANISIKISQNENYRPNARNLLKVIPSTIKNVSKYHWVKDLIVKCWNHDPEQRYSFSKLNEIIGKKLEERE